MSLDYINSKKIRKSFGKIPLVTSLPNLVEVQKRSFDNFLQLRVSVSDQKDNRKRNKNLLGEKGENTLSQKELFYNSSISLLDQIKFDYGLLRIAIRYDLQKIKAKPSFEIYNEKDNAIKLNVLNPSIGFTFNKFRNQSIYGSFATSFETPTPVSYTHLTLPTTPCV